MQTLSSNLKAALIDIDAQTTPRILIDTYEFYDSDATPGVSGFDPADALETFAAEELTWNLISYRRELISRSDIIRNMGEKTNSVTLTFSNISRYMATLAQSQTIEGMILVIRCVVPSVTDDSLVLFVGRCDKPSDIDKQQFTLTARQDFGNINQTLPPRKFTADDPEGRLPGDDLYEGIPFVAVPGTYTYPFVQPSSGTIGRLLQRRETVSRSEQFSSVANTPFGSVVPEIFGRCQMELIPIIAVDKGIYIGAVWAVCNGPISAITNVKTQQAGLSDPVCTFIPTPAAVHLGDAGGTGTNTGNTCQGDLGGGSKFSHLAYVEGAIIPTEYFTNPSLSDPNVLNDLPPVTAMVLGRKVALPDGSGVYNQEGWSDNPVHLARFILTDPAFVNINEAFIEDAVNYKTGLHCDQPLIDDTESQTILINTTDLGVAGSLFTRYQSTGIYTPRFYLYNHLGDLTIVPETVDGPYIGFDPIDPPEGIPCGIGFHRDPESGLCVPDLEPTPGPGPIPTNTTQPLLRKRYTFNGPITGEVRAVDYLYKTVFPSFKGFMRVNKRGKYEILSEKPSDATRIRSAIAVAATSIPVYDVTPWKTGDLLIGRVLLGNALTNSEVRNISSADYSTSGNSITLAAADTGGATATASGANLSGGSTTVQASGTVTIGGTPGAGDTVTITIDGVAVGYILGSQDTTATTAAMLTAYINATKRLSYYIVAEWNGASVVTIKCLHGALNVDTALLKAHTGPIADPTTAPTIAASGSGALQAGDYQVAYADQTVIGLTALTQAATVTLTANQKIDVSSLPAFPAGVTGRQFFVSDAPNSARLRYLVTRADASNFSINSLPSPGAANPPSYNSTSEELIRVAMSFATNSQDVFKPWTASTNLTIIGNLTDDTYLPTVPNGHKYQLTTGGLTGASEPTWPTSAGATVGSGTAVFTEIGSTVLQQAGLTRANIVKDSFKWPLGGQQSSVNQVKGSYRDAKNDFALTPYRVNDPVHQAQVKKVYPLEFDGSGIDNYSQFFRIANWLLSKNREGDWFDALETGPQGLILEEGDVICASDDSGGLINVATRIEELRIKPNHDVSIQRARKYSTAMFSDDVGSHSIAIPSTLKFVQTKNSIIEFIDSPPLRDADGLIPGFYVAVSHDLTLDGDWRGWELYADYGDGYKVIAKGDVAATLGTCTTTLGSVTDPSVWDRVNSVTFTLDYEEASAAPFTSVDEQDILSNSRRNLFLIGNEYVQAATVVSNGSRSYTISTLLRARFGSDGSNLGNLTHGSSERVVFINGAETLVQIDPVRLNGAYDYKAVTTNQDVADATAVPFIWTGGTIKPLAPVNLRGTRNATGDLLIEWTRRSRFASGLTPGSDVPTGEERDSFLVEIYSGATLKRTMPIAPSMSQGIIWRATNEYAVITGSTLAGSVGNGGSAEAYQRFNKTGGFFEFTIKRGSPSTTIIPRIVWMVDGFRRDLSLNISNTTLTVSAGVQVAGSYGSSAVTGSIPYNDGDRLRIMLSGTEVRFYLNYSAIGSIPFYVSPLALQFPVTIEGFAGNLSGTPPEMQSAVIYNGEASTIYSASQQTEDFGSTQSSLSVRVYQVSAVVGRGFYTSGTI